MLIRTIAQYLETHRRLVVPQMGAFIVKEPGTSVLFSELLKRDDGVLLSLLKAGGLDEAAAAGEIDRFVCEVRRAVGEGREFPLEGLGVLKAGPNGTLAFTYAPHAGGEKSAPRPEPTSNAQFQGRTEQYPASPEPAARHAAAQNPDIAKNPAVAENPAAPAASEPPVRKPETAEPASVAPDASGRTAADGGNLCGRPERPTPARPARPAQPVRPDDEPAPRSHFRLASKKLKRDELFADSCYGRLPRRPAIEQTVRVKKRSDHFIWIALIAAAIALAAIFFGQWCESFGREGEEVFLEQPAGLSPDGSMPQAF